MTLRTFQSALGSLPSTRTALSSRTFTSHCWCHLRSGRKCSRIEAQPQSKATIRSWVASDLISLALAGSIVLSPGSALADGPPPQTTTEVPAAVNAVVTEENAVVDRQNELKEGKVPEVSTEKKTVTSKVVLEMAVDGEPAGAIVIGTYNNPPVGSQRFLDLAKRSAGGFRLSRVDGLSDAYITVAGVLQMNYVGMPPVTGGETVEQLQAEQSLYPQRHDKPGLVSLVVEDAIPKDIKERVVAYKGKFIKVQEVKGSGNANGTGLAITLKPAAELDRTNLIIGEVTEGMDVVERLSALPKVKSSSKSPFFKVAKALGDRRADVAARSFGKPLNKVVVQTVKVLS